MHSVSLTLALGAFSTLAYGIDNTVNAISIAFDNEASIGPDGPWWYIPQAVDDPDQLVAMLPSLSNTTLIINASACASQSANCPLPMPTMWSWSVADDNSGDNRTISPDHSPSDWDVSQAALLNMTGTGKFFSQGMDLHPNGNTSTVGEELGFLEMTVSNSYAANFPGGGSYTLDAGFFSLYGAEQIFSWPDVNGFVWHNNRTLPDAYQSGYIPSNSYGLHVGSVYPNISGSLVLGGYDSSRCLSDPVVSNDEYVTLDGIYLNVSDGRGAFMNSASHPIYHMLKANGTNGTSLTVKPDPGVPYMYLPKDTCDAIAGHLPVTYDPDFNLYIWNTSAAQYQDIITSPHYIAFRFSSESGASNTTINVPFALLNLTLESPLISTPQQYFPCYPWTPEAAPYTLGRSFLQAAFLAQNWNSSTLFMAQAPGPDYLSPSVKNIQYTDTTITPASNPPSWDSTWASTLKALAQNGNGNSNSNGTSSGHKGGGLSAGAIAGIVVGVVLGIAAIVALLAFFLIRSRRRRNDVDKSGVGSAEEMRPYFGSTGGASAPPQYHDESPDGRTDHKDSPQQLPNNQVDHTPLVEAPSHVDPVELDGQGPIHELPSGQMQHKYR